MCQTWYFYIFCHHKPFQIFNFEQEDIFQSWASIGRFDLVYCQPAWTWISSNLIWKNKLGQLIQFTMFHLLISPIIKKINMIRAYRIKRFVYEDETMYLVTNNKRCGNTCRINICSLNSVSRILHHIHPCLIYEAIMRHIINKYEAIMKQISLIFSKNEVLGPAFLFTAKPL